VTFTRPEGGLFTWVTFPEASTPPSSCSRDPPPRKGGACARRHVLPNGPRLRYGRFSYSGLPDEQITDAIARLDALIPSEVGGRIKAT
jgi:2-aminoadipate transaminase